MGFENKLIRLVVNTPKIDKMIRKTYATNPKAYHEWEQYLTIEIKKLHDNYSREALINLITSHPYVEKIIKKEDKKIVEDLFNTVDNIAQQEIFFDYHIGKSEKKALVLLIANNDDQYGVSHALYWNDLFCSFSNNDMSLTKVKWLLECMQCEKTILEIDNNQQLTDYIEKNEKFPLWLHDLNFLNVPLQNEQPNKLKI